jgi:hypothetical protein
MVDIPFWKFKDQRERWTLGLAVLAILAALASALFTGLQWSAANRSADAADRSAKLAQQTLDASTASFEAEERAYIFVTQEVQLGTERAPFCKIPGAAPGRRICVDVHFLNGGKTPALGVRTTRFAIVADDEKAADKIKAFQIPPYKPEGSVMGPTGGTTNFDVVTAATDALTDAEWLGLKTGKQRIFVYGVVQYMDIFQKYHEDGFCAHRLPSGMFMYCAYHNWFDKKLPGQE